jgi:hypothetical protein
MFNVTYTHSYDNGIDFESSIIDNVFYNVNSRTAVLDINDYYYEYRDVPAEAVEDLINADSVGAHYNKVFKSAFGPSKYLGAWEECDLNSVPVNKDFDSTPVAKDFTVAEDTVAVETKEYSLQTPNQVRVDEGFDTVEYSLRTPAPLQVAADNVTDDVKSTVFFTLDGGDREFTFESDKSDLYDAVEEVDNYVKRLGARGNVRKVVFEFSE